MTYPAAPQPQPYYPAPFAPPPLTDENDLSSLSLDELLEKYALTRQAHRAQITWLNDAEKQAARLRDRESAIRQALLKIVSSSAEW
jgi:hypothetical protein